MPIDNKNDFYQKINLQWNLQLPIPLLLEALTHPSYKSVSPDANDNQRLEILGDAVLDLLVIDWLYNQNVKDEGILTKIRAEIVQNTRLSKIGQHGGISSVLRCAPAYQIQEKDLADAVEALFGAKYVAFGLESCQSLLVLLFEGDLKKILTQETKKDPMWGRNEHNPKNLVQEFFQKRQLPSPEYKLHKKEGDEHNPTYWYTCQGTYKNQVLIGKGQGNTKKKAQKRAAQNLYQQLLQLESSEKQEE